MLRDIYFAGGCFWGLQKYFNLVGGVMDTEVGYANGVIAEPSYEAVCSGDTGHAETVKVTYNDDLTSLRYLLEMFYAVIDPTSLNRQGNDEGTQYRTGVYYVDEADKMPIVESLRELQKQYDKPLAIELMPLKNYYPAEEYHQNYLDENPDGYCHIGESAFEKARNANQSCWKEV